MLAKFMFQLNTFVESVSLTGEEEPKWNCDN
jgi:hypothetical protein